MAGISVGVLRGLTGELLPSTPDPLPRLGVEAQLFESWKSSRPEICIEIPAFVVFLCNLIPVRPLPFAARPCMQVRVPVWDNAVVIAGC